MELQLDDSLYEFDKLRCVDVVFKKLCTLFIICEQGFTPWDVLGLDKLFDLLL
jgi:hypothetical protein